MQWRMLFCSKFCKVEEFRKIYREAPVPESIFNKVAGLRRQAKKYVLVFWRFFLHLFKVDNSNVIVNVFLSNLFMTNRRLFKRCSNVVNFSTMKSIQHETYLTKNTFATTNESGENLKFPEYKVARNFLLSNNI